MVPFTQRQASGEVCRFEPLSMATALAGEWTNGIKTTKGVSGDMDNSVCYTQRGLNPRWLWICLFCVCIMRTDHGWRKNPLNGITWKMTNRLKRILTTARQLWYISLVHSPLAPLQDHSMTSSFLKPPTPSPSSSLSTDDLNWNNRNNQKRNSLKLQFYIYYLSASLPMSLFFPSVTVGEPSLFLPRLMPCGRRVEGWRMKPHSNGMAGQAGAILNQV